MKLSHFCGVWLLAGIHATSARNGSAILAPAFEAYSVDTPRSGIIDALNLQDLSSTSTSLEKRDWADGDGTCAPGRPCSNGSCCSKSNFCGYSPSFCGAGNCTSNCNAKAQCGQYAPATSKVCPLNVCCSQYDFCGTGCDRTGGLCGASPGPTGKASQQTRNIGYYESWANTRPCDKVAPEDLDLTGLTHVNFAFAFFHPTTFKVMPMDANAGNLMKRFTNLKSVSTETWISLGGWSFNDPGNVPDTRMAFSDMVSSAGNRKLFITSMTSFMRNYGFDGVDIDWEYPVAPDRGGRPADKANFVALVKEMKAAFGNDFGISVTLPTSFWYLQHFDLVGMQPYVDWFNVMSYDLHGVWDASNRFTGPYIRPHTNLTEIDEMLGLLWRAGVKASNVVLGLGFYGRSFSLADPACKTPNGKCKFTAGAVAGSCTQASGILSAAEIGRVISDNNLTPVTDTKAAVKWITWDTNQWVSYDDESTFELKLSYIRKMGLSGQMIWALDQGVLGDSTTTTLSQFNGVSRLSRAGYSQLSIKSVKVDVAIDESCYTTFCDQECAPGFFSVATTRGKVGDLGIATMCYHGAYQNTCCRDGTTMGTCEWVGFRGIGLSCYGGACSSDATLIAVNSWQYEFDPEVGRDVDKPCNAYCCKGFKPTTRLARRAAPALVDDSSILANPKSIQKRDESGCAGVGVISNGQLFGSGWDALEMSEWGIDGGYASVICTHNLDYAPIDKLSGYSSSASKGGTKQGKRPQLPGALPPPNPGRGKGGPVKTTPGFAGRYKIASYPKGTVDCHISYTCEYGLGFDQVCDNQRYGLEQITFPNNIFYYRQIGGRHRDTQQWQWKSDHHTNYKVDFITRLSSGRLRCEVDEFPLNSLQESGNKRPQALRGLNGDENGNHARDWSDWLRAVYQPCAAIKPNPPITWYIATATLPANDPRVAAAPASFIARYGFDSSSGKVPCYATYTTKTTVYAQTVINGVTTMTPTTTSTLSIQVADHGFRVATNDPMFYRGWPRQDYAVDPNLLGQGAHPTSVNSANFVKRAATLVIPHGKTFATITATGNDTPVRTEVPAAQAGPNPLDNAGSHPTPTFVFTP